MIRVGAGSLCLGGGAKKKGRKSNANQDEEVAPPSNMIRGIDGRQTGNGGPMNDPRTAVPLSNHIHHNSHHQYHHHHTIGGHGSRGGGGGGGSNGGGGLHNQRGGYAATLSAIVRGKNNK